MSHFTEEKCVVTREIRKSAILMHSAKKRGSQKTPGKCEKLPKSDAVFCRSIASLDSRYHGTRVSRSKEIASAALSCSDLRAMIRPVQAMIRPLLVRALAAKVPEAASESICRFAAGPRGALCGSKIALTYHARSNHGTAWSNHESFPRSFSDEF